MDLTYLPRRLISLGVRYGISDDPNHTKAYNLEFNANSRTFNPKIIPKILEIFHG
jgi:hypothetical protein